MIARITCALAVFAASMSLATSVRADWFADVARDWKRCNCWPHPFVYPDRQAVREPFVGMIDNGWQRQNILADQHFEEGKAVLSDAGQQKIRWMLIDAPRYHRVAYVRKTISPSLTSARVEAVYKFVAEIAPDAEPLPVLETTVSAQGHPAEQVDLIQRGAIKAMPAPKLPDASGAGGNSGGNSGSGSK
jgi:hypothetical protein